VADTPGSSDQPYPVPLRATANCTQQVAIADMVFDVLKDAWLQFQRWGGCTSAWLGLGGSWGGCGFGVKPRCVDREPVCEYDL